MALLLLLAVLIGVPIAVVALIGMPLPSIAQLRELWRTQRVDTDLVVRLGATLFLVLWAWFAITALGELRRVLPHRHDPARAPRPVGSGPGALVCGLVRFVALSSVGAGLLTGGLAGVGHAEGRSAVTHLVVPGDSYWEIAEGHLDHTLGRNATNREVMVLTEQLVARNAPVLGHRDPTLLLPGETVTIVPPSEAVAAPPTSPPAIAAPAATVHIDSLVRDAVPHRVTEPAATSVPSVPVSPAPSSTVPEHAARARSADGRPSALPGIAGALLLAGGALITVESRRRRQWRAAMPESRAVAPTFARARTELLLRSLGPEERLARLDVSLRAVARDVAAQGAVVVAATTSDAGDVTLHLRGAALPTSVHWRADIARGVWHLSGATSLEDLAHDARDSVCPCPALVHLGNLDDGQALFVDLEAFGVVSVPPAPGLAMARAVVASLAVSPFRSGGSLRAVRVDGLPTSGDVADAVQVTDDARSAIVAARADAALVGAWAAGSSTFALRAAADSSDGWEPSVLVLGDADAEAAMVADVVGGAGLAVLLVGREPTQFRLVEDDDHLVFEPLGLRFRPCSVEPEELDAVAALLEASASTSESDRVVATEPDVPATLDPSSSPFVEPQWDLLVRMIGQVFVESAAGSIAEFERSKSLELVVWMALHRERSTRSGARSALWEVGVRSATFANVVSEARRALGALVSPAEGEDWIGRTLTDDLPLHPRVVTDADLLQARVNAARGLSHEDAIAVLRPGLELVTGLPFCSPCFAWVDGEGHTSALVLLATGAAVELAQHHLALGDIDGVFWATGQGLKVLPGHEALIALRMRAHASRGDLAGVRLEWEQYERALAADTWSSGEPSPKLVGLRRELLGQPMVRVGAPGA